MSDDVETRLRQGLHEAPLPGSPDALREFVATLLDEPVPARRRRPRLWIVLVPIAVALIGIFALAGGSPSPPPPSPVPAASTAIATATAIAATSPRPSVRASLPTTVDGLPVQSVSELLASRAAGKAAGGPYALGGYWTDRSVPSVSCRLPVDLPGELEFFCSDGEWGITELQEPIQDVQIKHQANETTISHLPPKGPHLTPYIPSDSDQRRLFAQNYVSGQFWPPVPIVVVGHFDDPKAADCRKPARQLCLDRFVIDRIVSFDPGAVPSPAPSPSPTPFPIADPPPALFTDAACYGGVPKAFTGWKLFSDLDIGIDGPGYVYAMVTRDVIPLGDWWQNPNYPGHRTRGWGQGVCYATGSGGMGSGSVAGTSFLEIDDGRHIAEQAPSTSPGASPAAS